MLTPEAIETVLEMAHRSYSKNFGPSEQEAEAIKEVEFLLSSWDEEGYDKDDYL